MSAHAIHDYKYTGYSKADDKIEGACAECGDKIRFPRLAKNRVSAWSAHGAGAVKGVIADETRFVDIEGWSIDETDS